MPNSGKPPEPGTDPNAAFVPRWEVLKLIADAIQRYDAEVNGPRLATLQNSLTTIEHLVIRIDGGMTVGKWIGAIMLGSSTLAGGIYAIVRTVGHF